MKRLYTPEQKDEIVYEMESYMRSIKQLTRKFHSVGLTEQEFKQLEIDKQKLRHLRNL